MSEANFFPASAGQFRGSKYPGFTNAASDGGNVQAVGPSSNVSASTGSNLTPEQVQQQQVNKGEAAAQTNGSLGEAGSAPPRPVSAITNQNPTTLGGVVAQTALPFAGNIAGTAAGNALATGESLGGALSKGGEALTSKVGDILNGNFGLLSSSAGATGGTLSAAGATAGGLPGVNVGVASVDKLGENAVSNGIGSSGSTSLGNIGGAGLSGLGTFAANLISGQGLAKSAISGIGAAGGAYLGSLILPGPGTIVGSFLGSMLGGLFGGKPSVGPNGVTPIGISNGQLLSENGAADNGADVEATNSVAKGTVDAINKILADNNLTLKEDPYRKYQGANYAGLGIYQGSDHANQYSLDHGGAPRSAMDVWNYLTSNGMVVSKTPSSPVVASGDISQSASTAPVRT